MRAFLYQINFAAGSLMRRKAKNISIPLLFALVISLFCSVEFIASSLYHQSLVALKYQPDIILQNLKAGRQLPLPVSWGKNIQGIIGIRKISPRVWGYYFDRYTGANYTIVGLSTEETQRRAHLSLKGNPYPLKEREVLIGKGIMDARCMKVGDTIQLEKPDGYPITFTVKGAFHADVALWTYDLIIMTPSAARDLFNMKKTEAWDLAIDVPNPIEVANVSQKVLNMFPGVRIIVKSQLISTYGTTYGFRSGLIITLSISCLIAFFILAYDRAAGLSREEQMEIAILKALGWETQNVIRLNMLQSLIMSITGFMLGLIGAYFYVFCLGAPGLRVALTGWSVLYPPYPLIPSVDITEVTSLLFLTVIPYIVVGIIPVWRSCIIDPEVIFRK